MSQDTDPVRAQSWKDADISLHQSPQVLTVMYTQQITQTRHYETLRLWLTAMMLVFGGLTAVFAFGPAAEGIELLWLSALLTGTSLMSTLVVFKQAERLRYHAELARQYRRRLDEMCPGVRVDRESVRRLMGKQFSFAHKLSLNILWLLPHMLIMVIGVNLLVTAIRGEIDAHKPVNVPAATVQQ